MNTNLLDNLDIQTQCLIQETNLEVWGEFLHDCINEITNNKHASFDKFKSLTNWTEDQYYTTFSKVKHFLIQIVLNKYDENKILKWCSEIDHDHQNTLLNNFHIRQREIEKALIIRNCALSGDVMNDFDWKVKLIYGTSKLSTFKNSLLELNLNLNEGNNSNEFSRQTKKDISIEMNKDELNNLIRNLEKSVSYLSD